MHSDILDQDRTILVGLPRNYDAEKKYPVLYLLDGRRYFLMAHGVIDFLEGRAQKIPEIILVSIPNIYRNTDLTPVYETDDPNARLIEYSGGAENFLKFIKDELQPFINSNYSSNDNNILFGHSVAGLFATYAFLNEPELFDSYITSDPSLWYGEGMMINKFSANKIAFQKIEKSIYMTQIDRSKDEEDIMSRPQADFMAILDELPNIRASKVLITGESHGTVPLKSLYQGLPFIFKDYEAEFGY
ncbi:MAG: alpha/beta hydrolase [Kordiimonadaceae bacterium]|nr:alpha/beta hydrolase [Kordiimonadaceae bacterium]MBT6329123.1 alpha/beta hydrolase [Kordiimonadaceae bacterium]MBT7583429.1 alpha/beta hydrolase [Kordiimonadaceae bacterium]